MSGFSALWRIRTRKNIRTARSIPRGPGPEGAIYRLWETVLLRVEEERLEGRRLLYQQRLAIQRLLALPRRR